MIGFTLTTFWSYTASLSHWGIVNFEHHTSLTRRWI